MKDLLGHTEPSIVHAWSVSTDIGCFQRKLKKPRCGRHWTDFASCTTRLCKSAGTRIPNRKLRSLHTSKWLNFQQSVSFGPSTERSIAICCKTSSQDSIGPIGHSFDASKQGRSLGSPVSRGADVTTPSLSRMPSTTTAFGSCAVGSAFGLLASAALRSSCTDSLRDGSSKCPSPAAAMDTGTLHSSATALQSSRSPQRVKVSALMLESRRSRHLATRPWSLTQGPKRLHNTVLPKHSARCLDESEGRSADAKPWSCLPRATIASDECDLISTTRWLSIWSKGSILSRLKSSTSKDLHKAFWQDKFTMLRGHSSWQLSRARLKALAANSLLWIHVAHLKNAAAAGLPFARISVSECINATNAYWSKTATPTLRKMFKGAGSAFGEVQSMDSPMIREAPSSPSAAGRGVVTIQNMVRSAKGTVEQPGVNVKAKSGLNRSILDAGWGLFVDMLRYKLAWSGGQLVEVTAAYSSQTCSNCGDVDADNRRSQAVFLCTSCQHSEHADINAAKVLKTRVSQSGLPGEASGLPSLRTRKSKTKLRVPRRSPSKKLRPSGRG